MGRGVRRSRLTVRSARHVGRPYAYAAPLAAVICAGWHAGSWRVRVMPRGRGSVISSGVAMTRSPLPTAAMTLDPRRPRLRTLPVADQGDRVRALGAVLAGVGDPLQVQVPAGLGAAGDAGVVHLGVVVAHGVAVRVARLDQCPQEDVAGVVGEGGVGSRPAAGAAVPPCRAGLVGDLPGVVARAGAVPDYPLELAVDPGVEDLLGGPRLQRGAVRHRGQLVAVQGVGLGLLAGRVARHAPPGVDGHRRQPQIPAQPHPAVAAG
jgi:hypothetical protein